MVDNESEGTISQLIKENRLKPSQYDRLVKFLRFHRPPFSTDIVDVILVPTDSPTVDLTGFNLRISSTLEFSQRYPNALVLFSGKRPDVSRASGQEMESGYSEAKVMADRAIDLGLNNAVILEEQSLHAGQNIKNSMDWLEDLGLESTDIRGILVVCSSYMARRLDYYIQKELKDRQLAARLNIFIYDADVAEDLVGDLLSDESLERKKMRILYEGQRLSSYRQKGDL